MVIPSSIYRRLTALLALAATLLVLQLKADIQLHQLLTRNMVLQQDTQVNLWGTADPGEEVRASGSWSSFMVSTIADSNGKWSLKLPTPKARTDGTTYTLTFTGKNTITLSNIAIGDVWVIGGQSNANYSMNYSMPGGSELLNTANIPMIRLRRFDAEPSTYPTLFLNRSQAFEYWRISSPDIASGMSAVGYCFIRNVYDHAKIPLALLQASKSGTNAQTWTPFPEIDSIPYYAGQGPFPSSGSFNQAHQPCIHFNGVIYALSHFTIKGVLWYQGESNMSSNPWLYAEVLPKLISGWRREWDQGDFPFYVVHPVPYPGYGTNAYPPTIEVQNAVLSLPNTAIVSTLDLASSNLHPPDKKPIGDRLAAIARVKEYGDNITWSCPVYAGHQVEDGKIRVFFDHTGSGLVLQGGASGFEIAGANGIYYSATASIEGDSLVLQSASVPSPVHLRYAWSTYPQAHLFNAEGYPTPPFRTDIPNYLPSIFSYIPGQFEWAGFDVPPDGNVDTGSLLGRLNVLLSPWVYQYGSGNWIYLEEEDFSPEGCWMFLTR